MKVTIDHGTFKNKSGVEYDTFYVSMYVCSVYLYNQHTKQSAYESHDFSHTYYECGDFQTRIHIEEFKTLKAAKLWCKRHGYTFDLSWRAEEAAMEGVE